jgi:hypothetical protein
MTAVVAVNDAVHPVSQSFPMLRMLVSPKAGKRSVLVAAAGRFCKCK